MKGIRIPRFSTMLRQLAWQVAGIVVLGASEKYVPSPWARWAVYGLAACIGIWYPITRAGLKATGLDATLENI